MKLAPLTLLFVCAAPARADVAVPQPAAKKTWGDTCAARIDEAAKKIGWPPGAHARVIPLLHEDGTPNPVVYVEYGHGIAHVSAGDDAERNPDEDWVQVAGYYTKDNGLFRRYHGRFAKTHGTRQSELKLALDDCLKMGEAK